MLFDYIFFFFYLIVVFFLVLLIPLFSTIFVYQENYQEKITSYECGFEPLESHIQQFEIRYYLVAILFLIFDLELIYLMPWIVSHRNFVYYPFLFMFIFYFLSVLAFYYEWLKGGLEWD